MKNADLILKLQSLPADADVQVLWDGAARTMIECIWLSRDGRVILCDECDVVYSDNDRPADAPDRAKDPYWHASQRAKP